MRALSGLFYVLLVWSSTAGLAYFGEVWNPVVMFGCAVAVGVFYLNYLHRRDTNAALAPRVGAYGTLLGFAAIAAQYEELRKLFVQYIPVRWSDVVPQLEAQCRWFWNGALPYQPVAFETYAAYPVYMPAHWGPLGMPMALGLDVRWSGVLLLGLASAWAGAYFMKRQIALPWRMAAVLLPSIAAWGFILYTGLEIAVSLETIVMAYYMGLCLALFSGRNLSIALMLAACLLSRYTLVFWLPTFAFVYWTTAGRRENFRLWGIIAASGLAFFILPFLTRDPDILFKGLKYHNDGAAAAWHGFGDPPVSYTQKAGVFFGLHLKKLLPGDSAHQVFLVRILQAVLMLALNALGIWGWRRWHSHLHRGGYLVLMLYVVMLFYYFFSPMTFRYYYLPLLGIAALMTGQVLTAGRSQYRTP